MNNFKPSGYNSVSPYFIVNGAEKFKTLMAEIFNATVTSSFRYARRFDNARRNTNR